jgi:hypothetical protein
MRMGRLEGTPSSKGPSLPPLLVTVIAEGAMLGSVGENGLGWIVLTKSSILDLGSASYRRHYIPCSWKSVLFISIPLDTSSSEG